MTPLRKFDERVGVNLDSDCWLWIAGKSHNGYGQFSHKGKTYRAHRWSYEYAKGKIPDGLQLDHLCRTRHCVNPDHLEAVTGKENCIRGNTGKATGKRQNLKSHCPQGHPYSGTNLYIAPRGTRGCRVCISAGRVKYIANLKRKLKCV